MVAEAQGCADARSLRQRPKEPASRCLRHGCAQVSRDSLRPAKDGWAVRSADMAVGSFDLRLRPERAGAAFIFAEGGGLLFDYRAQRTEAQHSGPDHIRRDLAVLGCRAFLDSLLGSLLVSSCAARAR